MWILKDLRFIIIGAERCGSTSLFEYIIRHPSFSRPKQKELEFFDRKFHYGLDWYNDQLPDGLTGEATPSYYFHPLVPRRIKENYPNTKLIMILRNPLEQVQSKYWQQVKRGDEYIPTFEEAVRVEPCRVSDDWYTLFNDEDAYTFRRFAYLARATYSKYIPEWLKHFAPNQLMFIDFKELFANPEHQMSRVFSFLGVDDVKFSEYPQLNSNGGYMEMDEKTKSKLRAYFTPYNEELFNLTGVDYNKVL